MGFIERRPGGGRDMNHYICYKKIDGNWLLFNDESVKYQKSIGSFHHIHLAFYRKLSSTDEYEIGLGNLSKRTTRTSQRSKGNLVFSHFKLIVYSNTINDKLIVNNLCISFVYFRF